MNFGFYETRTKILYRKRVVRKFEMSWKEMKLHSSDFGRKKSRTKKLQVSHRTILKRKVFLNQITHAEKKQNFIAQSDDNRWAGGEGDAVLSVTAY